MNGRVYDYNLGRFLSVDPFVHEGSQGLNPYSYIMNNPLSGTDPTGYSPEKETIEVTRDTEVIQGKDGNDYVSAGDGTGDLIKIESISTTSNGNTTTANFGDNGKVSSMSASNSAGTFEVSGIGGQEQIATFQANTSSPTTEVAAAGVAARATTGAASQGGASGSSFVKKAMGRAITLFGEAARGNPILTALAAMVYSPSLNSSEAASLATIRQGDSERRRNANEMRIQLQSGHDDLYSDVLLANPDTGVTKAQVWGALAQLYGVSKTSNSQWNKSLGSAVVNMSKKIKSINGGVASTGNVLRTNFVHDKKLYRIDLENWNGVNLVE